ncbi:MAG: DNA repair protein RecN [Bacteroidetes bacterium]|nr:DNA repair protein RecN [Bacteroidota bacterium]
MLKSLRIQNYALIDEIEIDFDSGFNVITGETGAGKSIILGALELILGKRVDTSVLFNPNKKCIIEGSFSLENDKQKQFFQTHDLDFDEHTIIRREISNSGKSRAFINDVPVTINILTDFSSLLLDIHSQYQTLLLNTNEFQFSILDAVAENKSLLIQYHKEYTNLLQLKKELNTLIQQESKAKKDLDYFEFQQKEIASLCLVAETDSKLEDELLTLSNAEKIKDTLDQLVYSFDDAEDSISQKLAEARKQMAGIASFNIKLEEFLRQIESVEIELKEIIPEMAAFSEKVDIDNQKLDELTVRFNAINNLLSKHQLNTVEELIALEQDLHTKIAGISSLQESIQDKEKQIVSTSTLLQKQALSLSEKRQGVIPELESRLVLLLASVGMNNASIKFDLSQNNLEEITENGLNNLAVLFSSNTGIPMQLVSKVASGGELSRLMLCIKHILAGSTLLPSIIFDEIDLGISGEIAFKVGEMMSKMADNHQIIAISHLPQVASFGLSHFLVYKTSDQNTTHTHLRKLSLEERILELAKMIGGENPSPMAMESAKELVRNFA